MRTNARRILAVAFAAVLVLGACSDDDGDAADPVTTTTEALRR
jgi:hypothetical protein